MFLVGRLWPLRPADWQYKEDPIRTPVIELVDGLRYWINWDLKHVLTLPPAEIDRLFDAEGFAPVARLRESHALGLQQKLLSSLGRVGLTAPMPATFLMRVEMLLPGPDRKLVRVSVPSLAVNDGVCFVGRPGDRDMRLVLTEDQCEGISDAIGVFDIGRVHSDAHLAFRYL
ncbi:hypothetical protein B1A_09132, partial [mine drainage metagenome]